MDAVQSESSRRSLQFFNTTTEEIPSFAAMEIAGYDPTSGRLLIQKPTRSGAVDILFNGPAPVQAGTEGQGTAPPFVPAAWFDDGSLDATAANAEALPKVGDTLGTVPGEWFLSRRSPGFRIISDFGYPGDKLAVVSLQSSRFVEYIDVVACASAGDGVPAGYAHGRVIYLDAYQGNWVLPPVPVYVWYVADTLVSTGPASGLASVGSGSSQIVIPTCPVQCVLAGTAYGRQVFVGKPSCPTCTPSSSGTSGTSGSGVSGSGSSASGSRTSGSGSVASGSISGSGSTAAGSTGTFTTVSNVGCTPGGSGTRVYFQTISLATGAVISNSYTDIGCCNCGGSTGSTGSSGGSTGSSGGSVGGSAIVVSCCANPINYQLNVTISGTGGGTFPMNYSGGNWDTGLISLTGAGAGTLTLRLYCFSSTWAFQNNTGSPTYTVTSISGPSPSTCSPFNQVFTGTLTGSGSYNGQVRTFTITF